MAPAKKDGKKKGHSAINKMLTGEYTINIHKQIQSMEWALRSMPLGYSKRSGNLP
jgi:large subunit ribosomal protein L31e